MAGVGRYSGSARSRRGHPSSADWGEDWTDPGTNLVVALRPNQLLLNRRSASASFARPKRFASDGGQPFGGAGPQLP
jgi:hypothetical protein